MKPDTEPLLGEGYSRLHDEKRESTGGCRRDDRRQFGQHGDRQRAILLFHPGFFLPDVEHTVSDVLRPHLDDITAPLRRVEQ